MGCYIWYSEEGPRRAAAPLSPLRTVPNVTAHPSAASVPTSYYFMWHYNCLWTLNGKGLSHELGLEMYGLEGGGLDPGPGLKIFASTTSLYPFRIHVNGFVYSADACNVAGVSCKVARVMFHLEFNKRHFVARVLFDYV